MASMSTSFVKLARCLVGLRCGQTSIAEGLLTLATFKRPPLLLIDFLQPNCCQRLVA
jgi:hypothetical protein